MKMNLLKWMLIVSILLIGFVSPALADGRGHRSDSGHHISNRSAGHHYHGPRHSHGHRRHDRLPPRVVRRHHSVPAPHHHGPMRIAERHHVAAPHITVHGLLPLLPPLPPLPLPFSLVVNLR